MVIIKIINGVDREMTNNGTDDPFLVLKKKCLNAFRKLSRFFLAS